MFISFFIESDTLGIKKCKNRREHLNGLNIGLLVSVVCRINEWFDEKLGSWWLVCYGQNNWQKKTAGWIHLNLKYSWLIDLALFFFGFNNLYWPGDIS